MSRRPSSGSSRRRPADPSAACGPRWGAGRSARVQVRSVRIRRSAHEAGGRAPDVPDGDGRRHRRSARRGVPPPAGLPPDGRPQRAERPPPRVRPPGHRPGVAALPRSLPRVPRRRRDPPVPRRGRRSDATRGPDGHRTRRGCRVHRHHRRPRTAVWSARLALGARHAAAALRVPELGRVRGRCDGRRAARLRASARRRGGRAPGCRRGGEALPCGRRPAARRAPLGGRATGGARCGSPRRRARSSRC